MWSLLRQFNCIFSLWMQEKLTSKSEEKRTDFYTGDAGKYLRGLGRVQVNLPDVSLHLGRSVLYFLNILSRAKERNNQNKDIIIYIVKMGILLKFLLVTRNIRVYISKLIWSVFRLNITRLLLILQEINRSSFRILILLSRFVMLLIV